MHKGQYGQIYVDMDDVIADFVGHVHTTFDVPHHERTNKLSDIPYKKELPKIKDWWYNIPPKHDAVELMSFLKKYNPHILSAYAEWDESSKTSKLLWMKKYFPWVPKDRINLVKRHQKQEYATSNGKPNILIDDYIKNMNEWKAAGGIGIQHVGAHSTIAKLKELGFS